MLYYLLIALYPSVSVFNVVRYITFRTAAASITALIISLVLGPWLIRRLRDFQIGQVIRQEGPQSHHAKAGTPTMGGLLILAAALGPTLLWADLTNVYVLIAIGATAAFGAIGFLDDYLKITHGGSHVDVVGLERPLQHASHLSVLQAIDPGSRMDVRAVCRVRTRGLEQRGQSH
jgi:phospho-N-acetylmuramoyl-pentapeptide-transferase